MRNKTSKTDLKTNEVNMGEITKQEKAKGLKCHYTFSLSPCVKEALAKHCKKHKVRESPILERILRKALGIPDV